VSNLLWIAFLLSPCLLLFSADKTNGSVSKSGDSSSDLFPLDKGPLADKGTNEPKHGRQDIYFLHEPDDRNVTITFITNAKAKILVYSAIVNP